MLDARRAFRFPPGMQRIHLAYGALLLLAAASAGCASTKLDSVWQNPAYSGGPLGKIMIIGLGATPGGRAEFENDVADALAEQGVTGVASVGYFADAAQLTRDAVREWVVRDGYQGVLVTRLESVQRTQYVQPPRYDDLWGYWGYYGVAVTPGYVVDQTKLRISSDLFAASSGQVIYTAEIRSYDPSSREKLIHELTTLLLTDLTKRELLPPGR
jgi:hypothetical protein